MIIHPILTDAIKNGIGLGSTSQCYDIMYSICRAFQCKKIVEIGTYKGYSTLTFCQAIIDNKQIPEIYAVDQWINYGNNISYAKEVAIKNFKETGYSNYIQIYQGDSKKILPELFKEIGKVDLCFIDGDHNLDGVMADYNNCKENSKILLFHDTFANGYLCNSYLDKVKEDGWQIITFPTKYIEGDAHFVGISLAYKNGNVQ